MLHGWDPAVAEFWRGTRIEVGLGRPNHKLRALIDPLILASYAFGHLGFQCLLILRFTYVYVN
jgi:hypothetical protein